VCNQVRTRNSSTEYLNGKCAHKYDEQEISQIYPDNIINSKNNNSNNNNNNKNNKYPETEIAFVLDGSGSIDPKDFEMAKYFIINVMQNVWTTCFSCKFAIVQFGSDIRTELSLTENNDTLRALDKVKNIEQFSSSTKTASALYHVLTEVFVPQMGSKEKAKKMIILLSDGEMAGDNRTLNDVLNMPQMDGIVRYAIGVGRDVLGNINAENEMIQIAGSKDQFFNVLNYGELEKIISSLEKSIIGIEDAGTEIAFVLDGSGSIEKKDFEMAKDFIINVMKNVWTTCFSCNFAIAQFGRDIRTELSLTENNDTLRALDKVKNITQITAITKTASALYHVLTEVFVPQMGSKEKAKKMIILLSDGQMAGDNRTLNDVLNMTQMDGIVRYAIGVGPEVLGKKKAINEMIQIAGSEDRFFNVSNYGALAKILSSLEKSIIGIEGIQKGAGFQFQLAEAGFSTHFTHDGSILFGAVGAYDWSGGIILKKRNEELVTFLNASKEEPRFSYLGYSVASVYSNEKTLYISGAPRYNLTGAVFIFDGTKQDLLHGEQVGSYFGSVLCTLDINNDGETDYLLVGAPHFHVKGEEGKVLLYRLNKGKFEKVSFELHGLQKYMFARFGSAIADIGDIDGNEFRDIAVGAPLEADHSGSVYIYNGFKDGLKKHFSQRITPSDFGIKLVHFGQAVSAMSDNNKQPLISVGSEGTIHFFKTIPVIVIQPEIEVTNGMITSDKQSNDESSKFDTKLQICFKTPKGDIKSGELLIEYDIDLDWGKEQKRLVFLKPNEGRVDFTLTESKSCTGWIEVKYVGCFDCFSSIKIRVNFKLTPATGFPLRALDAYSPKEAIKEILFEKECLSENCKAHISLANSKLSNSTVIIGKTQTLNISFDLKNSGDNSYMTTLTLVYPHLLSFKKSEGGTCENKNDNHQLVCKILYPIFQRNAETRVTITWQPINKNTSNTESITAQLTGGNNGSEVLDSKEYSFTVKKSLAVDLAGSAMPNRLNITEGEKSKPQILQFNFKLVGTNEYEAKIKVEITIEKQTHKTDIVIVSVEPNV
ncbi:integrin alpha-E isoform X1, partial [Silurus asotus]